MKISAVNNYHFNTVNFEGKKSKNQAPEHQATPIKAIPVAILMAMSPLNPVNTHAQVSQAQLERIQQTQDELIDQQLCLNATPDGNPGKISMYATRDGEEYIKLHLTKELETFAMDSTGKTVEAIKVIQTEIRPEEFLIENISYSGAGKGSSKEKRYYVIGSGIQYVSQIKDAKNGTPVRKAYADDINKIDYRKFEITEDFYNVIQQNRFNNVQTTEENTLVLRNIRH